jgi:HEAT repeat protein
VTTAAGGRPQGGPLESLLAFGPVFWAAAFQLCFVAAVTLLKVSANALLIARSATTWLPALYILSAITTGLLAMGIARLPRRHAGATPAGSLVLAAGLALLFWLALGQLGAVGLSVLYLAAEAFATLFSLRYWEAMGHSFDARQSRRLFTLFGATGMAGAMIGGALCPVLARSGSAGALLPASAGLIVATGVCGEAFARGHRGLAAPVRARLKGLRAAAVDYLRRDAYPRGLALCALTLAVLTAFTDYLFRRRAGAVLGERGLAALFGELNLVVGGVAVIFQLGFAQRVMARFGIFRYLTLPPIGVAGASALSLFFPGLMPIFFAKAIENAGSLSVTQSGFQLLYGPVTPELQAPVRGLVDGLMKKAGLALGGVLLLVLGTRCSDPVLAGAAVLVAVICAGALLSQKPRYVAALAQRLTAARPLLGGELDADARMLLAGELRSPEAYRVLNALELLSADRGFDPKPHLASLLSHPSDRVREIAVRLAAASTATEQLPRLLEMAEREPARRPKDEAVRALASLLPGPEALARLGTLVATDDPGLRAAAVEALWKLGEEGRAAAREGLERSLAGTSPPERREAARLLGRLGLTMAVDRLADLLADPDPSVRVLACASAAQLRLPVFMEQLFRLLNDRATRRAAREALAAFGDEAIGPAWAILDDRSQPIALRLEIPRLLRYIGSAEAAGALLFSNIQDDAFLRYRIGLSLSRWREQNPDLPVDAGRVRDAVGRRIEAYLHYLPIWADIQGALGEHALLTRALADRLDQNLEIVFRLLGLTYPHRALLGAHRRFTGKDTRERAQAVELLDELLDDELRHRLVPVLEAYHRGPQQPPPAHPGKLAARLDDLAGSRDVLLGALARAARRAQHPDDEEEVSVSTLGLEKILLLEGVDIFAGCSVDDLSALASIAHERRFEPGEAPYREGEAGDTLYVIVEGSVRIERAGRQLLTLGSKEAFGSVSLMDGAPRPTDAIAATQVRCLAMDRGDFLDLVADRPELLKGVFAVVTGQLRKMVELAAPPQTSPPIAKSA